MSVDSSNALFEETSAEGNPGYQNIVTMRDVDVPDVELLREVEAVEPGGENSDCKKEQQFMCSWCSVGSVFSLPSH